MSYLLSQAKNDSMKRLLLICDNVAIQIQFYLIEASLPGRIYQNLHTPKQQNTVYNCGSEETAWPSKWNARKKENRQQRHAGESGEQGHRYQGDFSSPCDLAKGQSYWPPDQNGRCSPPGAPFTWSPTWMVPPRALPDTVSHMWPVPPEVFHDCALFSSDSGPQDIIPAKGRGLFDHSQFTLAILRIKGWQPLDNRSF